jgi:hypothetical protein
MRVVLANLAIFNWYFGSVAAGTCVLDSRVDVVATYADLTGAGHKRLQAPYRRLVGFPICDRRRS